MFKSLWDFEGAWQLDRSIAHRTGQRAMLSGQALLTREGQGLLYHEIGLLHLERQSPVKAERRYLWRPGHGATIDVRFEDGRAFHSIDLQVPQARHDCAPDVYDVTYDFSDWPHWRSRWDVTGPKKDYAMTSVYRRSSSDCGL